MVAAADVSWPFVVVVTILFCFICFIAVLWSKREWNSRKIRVGLFMEREYRAEGEERDDEDTLEIPPERRE